MSDQLRPTPETDRNTYNRHQENCPKDVVPALICRRLERERDEAREALEDLLADGFDHGMTKIRAARKALATLKGGSDE
jgi:hypothetical protein